MPSMPACARTQHHRSVAKLLATSVSQRRWDSNQLAVALLLEPPCASTVLHVSAALVFAVRLA